MARPRAAPAAAHHASLSGLSPGVLERLAKLGVARRFDLVLHLPLRYDDETSISSIADAAPGSEVLVQGTVTDCDIKYRPKRQLVCRISDSSGELTLRFLNFYGSQMKTLAPGNVVRVFGSMRSGH
ncbi:MAG: ATP-dependent DNA helicase RecG, partial [Burkholderiales bacterium]